MDERVEILMRDDWWSEEAQSGYKNIIIKNWYV